MTGPIPLRSPSFNESQQKKLIFFLSSFFKNSNGTKSGNTLCKPNQYEWSSVEMKDWHPWKLKKILEAVLELLAITGQKG